MATVRSSAVALAAMAPGAFANLIINNWCGVGVSLVQSHDASCDFGVNGNCISDGDTPWTIAPGTGESTLELGYIADGIGTSVKISKNDVSEGVLQFEYNVVQGEFGGLYWDLSDLDGSGGGLVGTPFRDQNVKVTPTGNGAGQNTCVVIRCKANDVCLDSYQHPDDPNTRTCPLDTGHLYLDLCIPDGPFNNAASGDRLTAAPKPRVLVGTSVYNLHEPKVRRHFRA